MKKILVFLLILMTFSVAFAGISNDYSYSESAETPFVDENKKNKAHYTPSAEAKQVPDLIIPDDTEIPNVKYDAVIENPDDSVFINAEDMFKESAPIVLVSELKGEEGQIVGSILRERVSIVAYADRVQLDYDEVTHVYEAFTELKKALQFTDVVPDLKKYYSDEYIGKLAATQIFYIRPETNVEKFIDNNIKLNLRIIFQKSLQIGQNIPVILVKSVLTGKWSVIDPKTILENWYKDETFSVDFHDFGTVVFLEPRNN